MFSIGSCDKVFRQVVHALTRAGKSGIPGGRFGPPFLRYFTGLLAAIVLLAHFASTQAMAAPVDNTPATRFSLSDGGYGLSSDFGFLSAALAQGEGGDYCYITASAGAAFTFKATWATTLHRDTQSTDIKVDYFEMTGGQKATNLLIEAYYDEAGTQIMPAAGTYTLNKLPGSDSEAPDTITLTIGATDYDGLGDESFQSTCFPAPSATLTVDATGTGKGATAGTSPSTISCSANAGADAGTCEETVDPDTVIELTATPDANSIFTGWGDTCQQESGADNSICTMTMAESATVQPNFDLASRKLTILGSGSGSGSVAGSPGSIACTSTAGAESGTCSEDRSDGDVVTLTATPAQGSLFTGWQGCDEPSDNICAQTVTGGDDTVTATFGLPSGTITVVKNTAPALAGDGTFGFSSPEPQLDGLSLTTVNGAASSSAITLAGGSYVLTENEHEGWRLQDLQCTGDEDNGSVVSVADRQVTIDLDGGESITCTFTNVIDEDYVVTRTQNVIHNFLSERADMITANDPDLDRRLTRRGVQGGGNPLAFTGTGGSGNYSVSYATSLSAIASAFGDPAGSGNLLAYAPDGSAPAGTPRPGFDMWIEGSYSQSDNGSNESSGGLLYIGADYLVRPGFLVGMLGQFDWMKQVNDAAGTSVEGQGWMAGPYMVTRLRQNLVFDARAAWGRSDNDVDPLGLYTDSFKTDRWLARARLTGDFKSGAWTFAPQASLIYFEDRQKAYVDSLGIAIPEQTVSLGRVTFGPRIGYAYRNESGGVIEPYVELKGIWDFDKAETVDIGSGLASGSTDSLRARIQGGFSARMANGWSFTGEGFYDGIGADDLDIYGGKARITIPFN